MDGGTTGTWSDEVRRAFITTRLAEARRSDSPPTCCDEWTGQFARSPVVRVMQSTPPRRQTHWFSQWAANAPPPRRAESISFTHIVNPFKGGQDSEHRLAQETTLRSIAHAAALANSLGVRVDVICVMYPEDNEKGSSHVDICSGESFTIVEMNVSAVNTLPQFRHPVRLPFLNQILYAGWLHGKGSTRRAHRTTPHRAATAAAATPPPPRAATANTMCVTDAPTVCGGRRSDCVVRWGAACAVVRQSTSPTRTSTLACRRLCTCASRATCS
jgi:hypothetical protein